MDVIASLKSTNIPQIYGPTLQALVGRLEANRSEIEKAKRATFKYGQTERHKLDVYYPEHSNVGNEIRPPILLFTYGGGLETGDRLIPEGKGLIHKNLGAFFSKRGFLTVIADYRLVPAGAVYPDASRDVGDALEWIVGNLGKDGDTNRIFLMGHSAGALNQSLLLLHPTLLSNEVRKRIKGAVFNGGAFRFEGRAVMVRIQAYFGHDGMHITNSPYGLLRSASDAHVGRLPPVMNLLAEREPPFVVESVHAFGDLLKSRGVRVTDYVAEGHNHISVNFALMTGQGEEWAEEAVNWMRSQV